MRLFAIFLLCLLSACSTINDGFKYAESGLAGLITPHRPDVAQGNDLTQQMVAQLKPGLTRDQVRFILGTPLVADPFHANRWDYVYRLDTEREPIKQRHMVVYFQDGKLASLGGDVAAKLPTAGDALPTSEAKVIDITPDPNGPKTEPDSRVPQREDDQKHKSSGAQH